MTAKRTRKLYRKKWWAVRAYGGLALFHTRRMCYLAGGQVIYGSGEIMQVMVSELPKPSPRKKVRRGK